MRVDAILLLLDALVDEVLGVVDLQGVASRWVDIGECCCTSDDVIHRRGVEQKVIFINLPRGQEYS
jgi:hypothetical protein